VVMEASLHAASTRVPRGAPRALAAVQGVHIPARGPALLARDPCARRRRAPTPCEPASVAGLGHIMFAGLHVCEYTPRYMLCTSDLMIEISHYLYTRTLTHVHTHTHTHTQHTHVYAHTSTEIGRWGRHTRGGVEN